MILTEYLLNAGRRPQTAKRARKSPCNQVGRKEKKKKKKESEKGIGTEPVPLGGSCEWGKVSTPWEAPSPVGRLAGTDRELQSFGENTAAGLRQTADFTDGQCRCPALPSLRGASAGTGRGWVLELGLQRSDPERGLGAAVWKKAQGGGWGAGICVTTTEGVCRGSPDHLRGQVTLFGGCDRGGAGPTTVAFFPVCVLAEGRTLHGFQGQLWPAAATHPDARSSWGPPPLPLCARGVHLSQHCHQEPQDWASATTSAHPYQGDNA